MNEEPEIEEESGDIETYSPSDMSKLFRVDTKTLARWDRNGKFAGKGIRVFRTFGGHRRWSKEDVDRVFQELYTPRVVDED